MERTEWSEALSKPRAATDPAGIWLTKRELVSLFRANNHREREVPLASVCNDRKSSILHSMAIAKGCVLILLCALALGCAGGGSDVVDESNLVHFSASFAPSTSKVASGYIGSLLVTVRNAAGTTVGNPICLSRSISTSIFEGATDGSLTYDVKGYRAINCSGDILAFAYAKPIVSGHIDVSESLDSTITGITVEPFAFLVPIPYGDSVQFTAYAMVGNVQAVSSGEFTGFEWSVSPSEIGTIDQNGRFTAAEGTVGTMTGTITARFGSFEAERPVLIGVL